jgi:heme exporter protein A
MLEAVELDCSRSSRTLFRGLAFEVRGGELLHVAGPNGSGKTSLMRILCGLLQPDAGEVRWKASPIRALGDEYRRELIYIGHASGVKDDLTPDENLRAACALAGTAPTASQRAAALEDFGLSAHRDAPVRTLSQGQRRRVALARLALAERHALWLLDEPFAALDETACRHVRALMAAQRARGGVVVMTMHQHDALAPDARTIELAG